MPRHAGRLRATALACAALGWIAAARSIRAARPAEPTGAAATVMLYATVTDANGRFITDLSPNDFEISDNGSRQRLTVFRHDPEPMAVVVVVDRSPSVQPAEDTIRSAVRLFVDRLLPGDRAALGTFGHTVALIPSLTEDHAALLGHLDDPMPFPAGTALWDAVDAARAALSPEQGKRATIVFTDADDNCSVVDLDVLRGRIERGGMMLYGLGPDGGGSRQSRDLRAMVSATGGAYVGLAQVADLPGAAVRLADELHQQYALGFSAQKLDGRIHRLDVRPRRKGLVVRTRRFYVASNHEALD
jgi:Ca-activated chloride channel homolog